MLKIRIQIVRPERPPVAIPLDDDAHELAARSFVWTRWLLTLLAIVLVTFGVWRWRWGANTRAQLNAQIASLEHDGYAVREEQLRPVPPVPANRNAATIINDAAESVQRKWKFDQDTWTAWRKSITTFADELKSIRTAREQNLAADWSAILPRDTAHVLQPWNRIGDGFENLREQLWRAALVTSHEKKAGEAIDYLRDLLYIGRVSRSEPSAYSLMNASRADTWACDQLNPLVASLQRKDMGGMTREQIEALVAELDDATPSDLRAVRAATSGDVVRVLGERPFFTAFERAPPDEMQARGADWLRTGAWIVAGPYDDLRKLKSLQRVATIGAGFDDPALSVAMKRVRASAAVLPVDMPIEPAAWIAANTSSTPMPADAAVRAHFSSLAERRVLRTALALSLYAIDHDHAFPGKLDELVPKYLERVPIDPLSTDGASPLTYAEYGGSHIVYSVGYNEIDDVKAGWRVPYPMESSAAIRECQSHDYTVWVAEPSKVWQLMDSLRATPKE